MARRDIFHSEIRVALEKDGWQFQFWHGTIFFKGRSFRKPYNVIKLN